MIPHALSRLTLTVLFVGAALWTARGQGNLAAPPTADFPLPGGNFGNQRYSTLRQITPANIGRLGGAWTVNVMDKTPGSLQGTPIVIDGVMYIPAEPGGGVMALDAATGSVKWKRRPEEGGGRSVSRGVAVGGGKVFASAGGSTLMALDAKDGSTLWKIAFAEAGATLAPPIYHNGLVYIGIAGGESGVRSFFGAFDANTGKEAWRFFLVPGPGERGNETWEGESWKRGGAPVWTHPALDPALGMVYVATGNAWPDFDGSVRGGDNLFTASVVALDLETGAYKWHFQEVHHDVWDYDNVVSPVLADIMYQGQPRRILMHTGKTGLMYILDRVTGEPLIGIEEREVPQEPRIKTARTQPFPIGDSYVPTCPEPASVPAGMKSGCIFTPYFDEPVVIAPGTQGGMTWAPMSFSPATNLLYVPGSIIHSAFTHQGSFSRPPMASRSGTLTAMNPATNRIVWQKKVKYPIGGGSGLLSTASGLLFHGEPDGRIIAWDMKNGDELWSFQTGAGANAPVVSYEVGGEQYVAILAGGTRGYQMSAPGDSLWAFKLGGTVPPAPAPPEPPTVEPMRGGGRGGAAPAGGRQ
ncbi:MAG: PQQ-binding-like beta-propeller repeat protein [Acidobacteria bacterium]|nr:PQQ-binding-like beta-propeller repeat protein [Acidobacteriota bacterium]